jgi:hypothetical protein
MRTYRTKQPILTALLSCIALAFLGALPVAAAQSPGGYTNMSYGQGHGTQIEYLSPGGEAYLWYPGNKGILPGKWKLEGADICFAYGGNTYNPVTGHRGGGWECMAFNLHKKTLAERAKGDIFGLAGRKKVPYDLDRRQVTLKQVSARISGGAAAASDPTGGVPPQGGIVLECKAILANAERSKADMSLASTVYFHGKFMGKPCVKVDYARAIDLGKRSGTGAEAFIKTLRERAASGNPTAITALSKLGY